MRISDWSSDVCSSDLVGQEIVKRDEQAWQPSGVGLALQHVAQPELHAALDVHAVANARGFGNLERIAQRVDGRRPHNRRDRKSVVWGTSVSVRVDVGGRRSIKQKKKSKTV